jgi:ATP-dependent helicase YprA (DUF1998 family)
MSSASLPQPDESAAKPAGTTTPDNGRAAFELLHAGVQRQLWRMGWAKLRPLQVESIRHVLQSDDDLLICAATASGKTQAAFLPVLSTIADEPHGSVRALYVGPLKALINDQFGRVGELCEYLELPVHGWHGDIAASEEDEAGQGSGRRAADHPGVHRVAVREPLGTLVH